VEFDLEFWFQSFCNSLDWSYIWNSFTVGHSTSACVRGGAIHDLIHRLTHPIAADGQNYSNPDASIYEARDSACVSMYSWILVSLPFRTVMSKTHSSLTLIRGFDFPVATR